MTSSSGKVMAAVVSVGAALLVSGYLAGSARGGPMYDSIPINNLIVAQQVDVTELLKRLGDQRFPARERAELELQAALPKLTPEQIEEVRKAAKGLGLAQADLEIQHRANRIFRRFIGQLAEVSAIVNLTQTQVTQRGITGYRFRFNNIRGAVNDIQGNMDYLMIEKLALQLQDELRSGETAKANQLLGDLKTFIQNLPQDRFNGLRFQATRERVLELVQMAIDTIPLAEAAISGAAGANPAGQRRQTSLQNPGAVDTGHTFQLAIQELLTGGELDLFFALDELNAGTVPPEGFNFAGHIFRLIADENLHVSGTVSVGIQYGPGLLLGNPVIDPAQLQVTRIANGQAQILETVFHDFGNAVLFASYQAQSEAPNQFGVFALLQPIPEPNIGGLVLLGLLPLLFLGRRRLLPRQRSCF